MSLPFNTPAPAESKSGSLSQAVLADADADAPAEQAKPAPQSVRSDSQRRLERELSKILERRPSKKSKRKVRSTINADIEPPEPPSRPGLGSSPADETDSASGYEMTRAELEARNTAWLENARRARRRQSLRLAASWLVALLVAGFIVAIVAAILFGMPGIKTADRHPDAVLTAGKNAEPATRWRLDWN